MTNEPETESLDSYHARNCKICRHPDRAAIEFDYLQWRSPEYIAKEYAFSMRSLYRHVHAVGLVQRRRRNLRASLELAIEGVGKATPTIEGVLKAVQLYARMNEAGEIQEIPKTQVIVISKDGSQPVLPSSLGAIPNLRIDHAALGSGEDEFLNQSEAFQPVNPSQTDFDLTH